VESSILESCYSTTSFEISIEEIIFADIFCNLHLCDIGFDSAYFDLTEAEDYLAPGMQVLGYYTYFPEEGFEEIENPGYFRNTFNAQIVYVKVDNPFDDACYFLTSIRLSVKDCPPWVPEGFSPNGDGINDSFVITGLYDIFPNFRLKIFSRYGNLIYEGNNDIPAWDGTANRGLTGIGNQLPTGTYFWVLDLNHPQYRIMKGWVYLNR
jgi:gliding motility-associated-like protein